jgi:hypothetical protein
MGANVLVEQVRIILVEHDLVGAEDTDAYGDEARAILCRFHEAQAAYELTVIIYEELDASFSGLVGDGPSSCEALGQALWALHESSRRSG